MITPTFAQIDALATAPSVACEDYRRYLEHAKHREDYDGDPGRCRCQDGDSALFCLAPVHFRPWWAP